MVNSIDWVRQRLNIFSYHHHTSSILSSSYTSSLLAILFLDKEGFLVVPTSVSSDGNERMSVTFTSSKRRRRLIEAMVLLRDWPLVLVMWFANFLTNMAWGPMPPVVEKHRGAKFSFTSSKSFKGFT